MYSAINNPDGFGFAIVVSSEKRIIVEHTMDPDEAINRFLELRAKYPDDYALWHARYATHGSTDLSNCHPFYVLDDQTVLAHNGVLSVDIKAGDTRSDTRIFADEILAKMGGVTALDNPHLYGMIEEYTSGSKLCVLTVDAKAQYQMYLIHADKGHEDENKVWWSNDSCEANYYLAQYYTKPASHSYPCVGCQTPLDETAFYEQAICTVCATCQWCDMVASDCLCYKKESSIPKAHAGYDNYAWGF
jgi:glutamine amidotransferase